jgi:hypothetical protein
MYSMGGGLGRNGCNRLQRCYERRNVVIDAFFDLADAIITVRSVTSFVALGPPTAGTPTLTTTMKLRLSARPLISVDVGVELLSTAGDVVAHGGVGDLGVVLVHELLPDPPDGVPPVGWPGPVLQQDRVDDLFVGIQLGLA